jgi:putative ABC transport system permease protein
MDLNFFLSSLLLVILVLNVMGIWGVSKIHIKQKNKEMGIRKVLGADNVSLVVILSRRLVMLLAASLVISLPLAFIMSQKWLDGYAVRVDISFLNFIVPLVTIVVIIGISVFYHIAKVVTTNPIHFIRETE